MKLNWRAWHALANSEAVDKGRKAKPAPLPKKVRQKLISPHTDGPHSSN